MLKESTDVSDRLDSHITPEHRYHQHQTYQGVDELPSWRPSSPDCQRLSFFCVSRRGKGRERKGREQALNVWVEKATKRKGSTLIFYEELRKKKIMLVYS